MMSEKSKRVALIGVISSFAIILGYIEMLISFGFFIPGVKLGLANLAIVTVMYILENKAAFAVNIIRVIISGILFANLFSILFSLAGALLSFGVMIVLKKTDMFSVMGVSIAGGVSHNIGQIIIAALVIETYSVVYYIPVIIIAGIITGTIIGIVSGILIKYIKIIMKV